ncbi:MAG: hypothetical protein ACYCZA_02315 [Thiobacillus sp.]
MTMPAPLRYFLVGLSLCFSCQSGASAMSAKPSLETGKPPQSYRLDEVSIQMTRQPGRGHFQVRRVSLSGTGAATLEQDGQKLPFHYTSKDLLALLNDLYKIRFFEMPANYSIRHSVFLKDDDTIGTSMLRMLDESSTSVCFSVAAYKRCVTYGTEGPGELENIAARIFTEADKLAGARQP